MSITLGITQLPPRNEVLGPGSLFVCHNHHFADTVLVKRFTDSQANTPTASLRQGKNAVHAADASQGFISDESCFRPGTRIFSAKYRAIEQRRFFPSKTIQCEREGRQDDKVGPIARRGFRS